MAVIVDTLNPRPRHPEKAHRPDAPILRKPDWIRVKAPVSRGYSETQKIVRANGLSTLSITYPSTISWHKRERFAKAST